MSDVIGEQAVEAPAVEPVVEAEQAGEDPLLEAIESGFSELERAEAVRDGTTEAEAESESPEADGVPWAELSRLDQESGQAAWRQEQQEQQEQRYAVEDYQQWQSAEQVAAAEAQYEERRAEVFSDVLDRLNDALEQEDRAAAVHLADEVAADGDPSMLGEFLQAWDTADPHEARAYEQAFRARGAEMQQAGFHEGQRLAEMQQAAWQDQYVQDWLENDQRQQAENAQAMSDEINRLSKADPAFGRLADTVVSIATPMFQQWQGELTPEVAAQLVRSSYENAAALQSAKQSAPFLAALDEAIAHQDLMADRTNTVGRPDPERAKFEATAELIQSSPLGEVSRARQRSLAGDTPGHPDAYEMLSALDDHIEADERSRASQNESLKAIAKSKAAAEKKAKR